MEMQNYLNDRIKDGLVEIHHLNNERNPIPHPPSVFLDLGPQVIVAEDDRKEVDGPRVPAPAEVEEDEDEEVEPVSDEDGEAIFDANSDDDAASKSRKRNYEAGASQCKAPVVAKTQYRPSTVSMKYGRQSTQGYAQGSRLSADRCVSHKQDGDARQTRGFIQVRPPRRRTTYVLRLIVLLYVNERCFLEGSPARLI